MITQMADDIDVWICTEGQSHCDPLKLPADVDILLMTEPAEVKACYPDGMSNELWANGVAELYSVPRVAECASQCGLTQGWSLDKLTADKDGER